MRRLRATAAGLILLMTSTALASEPARLMVSVSADGTPADEDVEHPALSGDGEVAAFATIAANLVEGVTNRGSPPVWIRAGMDVYARDVADGPIARVSVDSTGKQARFNGVSEHPSVSGDGRYVVFASDSGFIPLDGNGVPDVYVHDRHTGSTELVSITPGGSAGNDRSNYPSISADGRYVAFASWASNLTDGDTNATMDIFVRDRQEGATERVSLSTAGEQGDGSSLFPSISADGRYVSFVSQARNLVEPRALGIFDVYLHDRQTGETEQVSVNSRGVVGNEISYFSSVSADGRFIAFDSTANNLVPQDTNNWADVFVRDRSTGRTERVSVSSDGVEGDGHSIHPTISPDGRYVAFTSEASTFVEGAVAGTRLVYVHDRATGITELASTGLEGLPDDQVETDTSTGAMSDDGRRVAVVSAASNLSSAAATGKRQAYVFDLGPAIGVHELAASSDGERWRLTGRLALAGVPVADAVPTEPPPLVAAAGGELSRVRLAYRPDLGDLHVRLQLAPGVPGPDPTLFFPGTQDIRPPLPGGTPGVVQGVTFEASGERYEVRATVAVPGFPSFTLHRCGLVCEQVAELKGGHMTTDDAVTFSIPLDLVGLAAGDSADAVRAYTAAGVGSVSGVHDVALGDIALPAPTVGVGFGRPDVAPADAELTLIELSGDRLDHQLDPPDDVAGVWLRTCLADACHLQWAAIS